MKHIIHTLFLLLFFIHGFSQDLNFEVRGMYTSPVTKETLNAAKTMSDFRPGFPSTWINDYISTEISVTGTEKFMKANGINETLNAEQQIFLNMADIGNEIVVDVAYRYKNSVTGKNDIRQMHFVMTVVPEIEAEYPGGYQQLSIYLEKTAIHKISEKIAKEMHPVIIRFTVTEAGEIANAQVSESSENPEIDKLLLKAINQMPKWKPAENLKGQKMKQEFEFSVGNEGC